MSPWLVGVGAIVAALLAPAVVYWMHSVPWRRPLRWLGVIPWVGPPRRLATWLNRDEHGSAGLEFMLVLGFIMLPMMFLVTAVSWPSRINAASAAAYEAAKAVVSAPDPAAAEDTGRARALEVIANHGFDTGDVTVSFNLSDPGRGDVVVASVTITLPALDFPTFGAWDPIRFTRTSSQRVGDFRGFE